MSLFCLRSKVSKHLGGAVARVYLIHAFLKTFIFLIFWETGLDGVGVQSPYECNCLMRPKEGDGTLGVGIEKLWAPQHGCRESPSSALEGHQEFFIPEPSPQPLVYAFRRSLWDAGVHLRMRKEPREQRDDWMPVSTAWWSSTRTIKGLDKELV